jgi:Xaa-Pro aminopeptidase
MKYLPIKQQLFIKNRERFSNLLQPNSLAIFNSNDEMPRNGDQNFLFRQNSDLFYLTGIDQEQSILVIYPDSFRLEYREILFLRETNEHIAVWEGHKYTKEEATTTSGVKTIFWLDAFEGVLKDLMSNVENVYVNLNENIRFSSDVKCRDMRFAEELKKKFPLHNYKRAAPLVTQLRVIKSAEEVELIREACNITAKAFNKVLNFIKPGAMEYEVEAEIIHEFIRNRANGHSYNPIIASGTNACVLHYVENNKPCKDGDLVLLDFGAEYAYYAGDLSRTIPVNGKFTKRQKDVYNATLRVMKYAISKLVIGITIDAYHVEVCKFMEKELIGLGLFTADDVKKQNPHIPLFKKYYSHGTSHFMGLDVHDVGSKQELLKEGMVFSCEPGIYIPEEGIGIRIENDILVTKNGPVDLMKHIPVEVEEIEAIMAKAK